MRLLLCDSVFIPRRPASPRSERTVSDADVNSQLASDEFDPETVDTPVPAMVEPESNGTAGSVATVDPNTAIPTAMEETPAALVPALPNTTAPPATLVPTIPNTTVPPATLVPTIPNTATPTSTAIPTVPKDNAAEATRTDAVAPPTEARATTSNNASRVAPIVVKGANYDTTMNDFEDPEPLYR